MSWIHSLTFCEEVNKECDFGWMLKCIKVSCFYTTEIMDLSQFLLVFICNCVILSNRMVVLNTILLEDNSTGVADNLSTPYVVHLLVIYILTLLFHHPYCLCMLL